MTSLFIHWNFNPIAFSIGDFEIRWYGILFACVFLLGYTVLGRMLKREGEPATMIEDLLWYVAIAVVIGARLGHCFFYDPAYYLSHPIEIFYIRDGGLASHGAAISIPIALCLVARKYRKSVWYMLDRVVIVVALGGLLIRTGNLVNSEIYGHVTSLPWGFIFERNGEILPKHPTQIYEALSYFTIFIFLYRYYLKNWKEMKGGFLFACFLIAVFGMRFLIEFIKEPQEAWEESLWINMGQILSIPFILGGIAILLFLRKRDLPFFPKKRKQVDKATS